MTTRSPTASATRDITASDQGLFQQYQNVRGASIGFAAPLAPEDQVIQSMPDTSPTKWHLAHTSWFFETFLLKPHLGGYRPLDDAYDYLFNSYYQQVGPQFSRPHRGLLSRPTVDEVLDFRAHVDEAMARLLMRNDPEIASLTLLGLHHEQQHQELMVTDIKHVLAQNPLAPAPYADERPAAGREASAMEWLDFDGGIREIGHEGDGFAFDNEGPRHRTYLEPFSLATRPVTNGEFMAFMDDDGYRNPSLWLSDGWAAVNERGWQAPLYWEPGADGWTRYTLHGREIVDAAAPVTHVSYYEAAAFAEWCGARLPTEAEWEVASAGMGTEGRFFDIGRLEPLPAPSGDGLLQMFGDVWEWTMSPYAPYPRYRPAAGAIGEYNGKFMSNQMVLRGGSCATPGGHVRPTYRNFFPPDARWQFSGFRLAKDR